MEENMHYRVFTILHVLHESKTTRQDIKEGVEFVYAIYAR